MRRLLDGLLGAAATLLAVVFLWQTAVHPTLSPAPSATAAAATEARSASRSSEDRPPAAATGSVRTVAERARPAVVQITSERLVLDPSGRPAASGRGVGSGVMYDPDGLILTNNHVVEEAQSLMVSLPDGRVYQGTLLGGDSQMDLAVVKIDRRPDESLPVAVLGDSEALAVGDGLVAIGNALGLPGGPTVTAGVVSAVGRAIQEPSEAPGEPGPYLYDLIQTDAAINPGNSGGPLLNMAGEVVGINTVAAGGNGEFMAQGIGFAIAINAARPIVDQLAAEGRVRHPFLGVAYGLVTPAVAKQLGLEVSQGVILGQVVANSPAARAGLRPRDVITAVDGQPIVDETTLGRALNRRKPGEQVQLGVARGSERLTLDVTLGEKPGR